MSPLGRRQPKILCLILTYCMLVSFLCFNKIYCLEYSCFKWETKEYPFQKMIFLNLYEILYLLKLVVLVRGIEHSRG